MTRLVKLLFGCVVTTALAGCGSSGSGGDPQAGTASSSIATTKSTSTSSVKSVEESSSFDSSSSVGVDDIPDPLVFDDVVDAGFGEWVVFGPFTIAGINTEIEASITGGEIASSDLPFSSANLQLTSGQELTIRLRTENRSLTQSSAQLTLGDQTYELTALTRADIEPPQGRVTFPIGNASTNQHEISVSGTASDNEGVFSVSVNGVPARSDNGFMTWSAQIPLSSGINEIEVTVIDSASNINDQAVAAKIERQPILNGPEGLAIDHASQLVYLVDSNTKSIYSVNTDGLRKLVSGPGKGVGESFQAIDRIAIGFDRRFLYVSDSRNDLIYQVDIDSGNRKIVSSDSIGMGMNFRLPNGLVSVSENDLLVADALNGRIARVNIENGNIVEISGPQVGGGVQLQEPRDIELSLDKKTAYVTDLERKAVISIDLATGNREVISSASVGTGELITQPESVVLDQANNRLFVTNWSTIIAVGLDTGDRRLVTSSGLGEGAESGIYWDLELLSSGNIVASDVHNEYLVVISPDTGDRNVYTSKSGMYERSWRQPEGLALSNGGRSLVVSDAGLGQVVKFDIGDQSTTVILDRNSDGFSPNVPIHRFAYDDQNEVIYFAANLFSRVVAFQQSSVVGNAIFDEELTEEYLGIIGSIVVDPVRSYLYYSVRDAASIYQVDIATGERRAISSPSVGSGVEMRRPVDLYMNQSANQLFALSDTAETLFKIDIDEQKRTVTSSYFYEVGSGDGLSGADIFDVDLHQQLAWVVGFNNDEIYEVDLSTGDRELISSLEDGNGISVAYSEDVVYNPQTNSLFITTPNDGYIIQVDRVTGNRAFLFP